jgi:uncharacterized Zn-binding protein involved in type VI secretion
MPALSRKNDANNAGGKIVRGSTTVFCNGRPVGLHVSPITPHSPKPNRSPHGSSRTTEGSPTVFCDGVPVLRVGSGNSCGHKITEGSPDVNVE